MIEPTVASENLDVSVAVWACFCRGEAGVEPGCPRKDAADWPNVARNCAPAGVDNSVPRGRLRIEGSNVYWPLLSCVTTGFCKATALFECGCKLWRSSPCPRFPSVPANGGNKRVEGSTLCTVLGVGVSPALDLVGVSNDVRAISSGEPSRRSKRSD